MKVEYSSGFLKKARKFFKKHPELQETFRELVEIIRENPFDEKLNTHRITKKNKPNLYSSSLTQSYRVLSEILIIDNVIIFVHIGNHDEVYGKK